LVRYIIDKSRSFTSFNSVDLNTLKNIININENDKYTNIVNNARIPGNDDLFAFTLIRTDLSSSIDVEIIKALYYFIYVHKYIDHQDDSNFFPDIIVDQTNTIDNNEYNNCKKQIKEIILDPGFAPLINRYYSQMALTRNNFTGSDQTNEFFIMFVLIDTIYIIFHKYYNELNGHIIDHLNYIRQQYNESHVDHLQKIDNQEEQQLFSNMFGNNISPSNRNLTAVALNPIIGVSSDASVQMAQMFSLNSNVLLPTNINESELITSGDALGELTTISGDINDLDDENIHIIRTVPNLELMQQQKQMFNNPRQPLHTIPTDLDIPSQTMSMQGCPIIPLRLNQG